MKRVAIGAGLVALLILVSVASFVAGARIGPRLGQANEERSAIGVYRDAGGLNERLAAGWIVERSDMVGTSDLPIRIYVLRRPR